MKFVKIRKVRKVRMEIVCLLGSPRPGGNSATIARRFMETAAALGAGIRIFELNRLNVKGCQGCWSCKKKYEMCVVEDDLKDALEEIPKADVLVLATPIYCREITAQLKCFIDRSFSYLRPDYLTNPHPSRLPPGKKLVFIITQGFPDEGRFAEIFPRYDNFLRPRIGFAESFLIRACGVGTSGEIDVPEKFLRQAEDLARAIVASMGDRGILESEGNSRV
jgi:multimeric flavodoxin WrbA